MEILNFILILINLIFMICAVLFFKNYLPNYFSKKGENLATKEDIADITKKVEDVKHVFNKELSQYNAYIDVEKAIKINHRSEERKCLIDFHYYISEFFHESHSVDLKNIVNYKLNFPLEDIKRQKLISLYLTKIKLLVTKPEILLYANKLLQIGREATASGYKLNCELVDNLENQTHQISSELIFQQEQIKTRLIDSLQSYENTFNQDEIIFIELVRGYLLSNSEK